MATADELLASGSSTDKTLVIDNDLRMIKIPSSVKNLGVENDDDVLRLDFRMPRYLGETDLSTFEIRINYLNANGEGDVYTVSDMQIVGDNLTFSWLVGPTATAYKGNTTFNVCMKIVDSEGYIQKEYNTTIATLPVLEGLETEEGLVEYYSDILEQWKRELFGIGDTEESSIRAVSAEEQENIAQKGIEVLGTIPEDYQTTYEMANNAYRTRANAIVSTEQGETIILDDASDDPLRGLRIFGKATQVTTTGKNLFDVAAALANQKRATTAVTDYVAYGNGVRVTTNSHDHGRAYMYLTLAAGEYNISANVSVSGSWNFSVKNYDTDTELINNTTTTAGAISYSFTLDTTALVGFCFMSAVTGGPATTATDIQLELGSAATEYEPYSGGFVSPSPDWSQPLESLDNVNIVVAGKNLLNVTTGGEAVGVTETVYNGLVSFSGTATGSGGRVLWKRSDEVVLYPGTYTLSAIVPSGTAPTPCLSRTGTNTIIANGQYTTFTLDETTTVFLGFNYILDRVYDATDVAVQLEVGSDATDYEPHVNLQTMVIAGRTLHGVPVSQNGNYTDSNGQQWIGDEIDLERGVHVQKIGVMTFTNAFEYLNVSSVDGSGVFYAGLSGYDPTDNTLGMMSTHFRFAGYDTHNSAAVGHLSDGEFSYICNPTAGARIYFAVAGVTSKEEATEWLATNNPVVYYPLKTPVETELTPEELVTFGALHSNYPNTTILNDVGATMEVKYNEDLKMYADEIMQDAANVVITQDKIQSAVDAWLSAHYSTAEGVSF